MPEKLIQMGATGLEEIYRNLPLIDIPWNQEIPPELLIQLIESGQVTPCHAIDLGCGAGNYAIYLAGKGFQMTGVDISPTAIKLARKNAQRKNVQCDFLVCNVAGNLLKKVKNRFGFAFEWEVLHHIYPEYREKYARNVHAVLEPGGLYFSVCFHEDDPNFGGKGKFRRTPIGTELYFSSERELRDLFSLFFDIQELTIKEIPGKGLSHVVTYAFMKKK
jgi:SAM-dependent methyltransferase